MNALLAQKQKINRTLFLIIVMTVPFFPEFAHSNCINCHKQIAAKKFVHAAAQMGCESCHSEPHQKKTKFSKGLSSEIPDLCYKCHNMTYISEIKIHAIVAGGMCLECHEPHSSENAKLLTLFGFASQELARKKGQEHEEELKTLKEKEELEKQALPSEIALNITFSDNKWFFPNNSLDAGEDAEMIVTIKNTGKGTGYGTNLEVTSDNSKITFDKEISVGDIQPNETKEIKVNLKAGLDIGDGKTSFQFNLKEKRGYDAKKVVVYVPTARLEKPELEIVSTEINDGDTGLAKGNGNGIPESGETIELTAFIKNQGIGKAIGVNLNGNDITSGIDWVRDSILVGTIQQGEIAKAKIAFTIPRNFDTKEITANLKATDIRGVSNVEKKMALSYAKRSPDIQYAYRIYSKGNPVGTITNGEECEIELTLSNKGHIPANNVVVSISSDDVKLSRSKIDIGEIKEQASISGQRFILSVPRTFVDSRIPINLEISQSDFSSVGSTISIPVDVKSPRLKYAANLLSKSGGNNLEQGESAIMEIQVLNEGNLPAEGVKIKLANKDENLRILGQTETLIGKIPANSKSETIKFQLSTLRRIKIGETYLSVNITQNDFLPVDSQHALNIREEGVTVVDIAAEDRGKNQTVTKTQSGPAINLKSPQTSETTGDENIRLAFETTDSRNIESIKVTVNGNVILDEKPACKKKEILKNIPLKGGDNKIVIIAYNADNIPSRKELTVTRAAEDDVDSPPVTGLNNPDAVAVVIGISKYESRDIPSVDYAKKDAETVKKYLINTLGFKETNIKEFYDEQATSKKLESYFKTHLKNRVRPNISDVFIFYSGHGVPENNEPYFVPYDLDPYDIRTTGYAVKELYKQMEEIKAKSV
ncbi:MAG: caspase family protein, partial [Nitrospirae bacterium]|nr:caspase family protein [Nitrospirota bacterium]